MGIHLGFKRQNQYLSKAFLLLTLLVFYQNCGEFNPNEVHTLASGSGQNQANDNHGNNNNEVETPEDRQEPVDSVMEPPAEPPENQPAEPEDMACVSAVERPCLSGDASCSESVRIENSTLPVWRSLSLDRKHCEIKHVVVVLHGRSRNPDDYFSYATSAAQSAQRIENTLIVSPAFFEFSDSKGATDLYWDRRTGSASMNDWAMGGHSAGPDKISSYEVLEKLIEHLMTSAHFPNVNSLVVAGHSAGGQLAQRFALTGNRENEDRRQWIFSYVTANPSSYAYLDQRRPVAGSDSDFANPSGCRYWNEWGYGLEDPNLFVAQASSAEHIDRYLKRKVTYFLGGSDTTTASLDVTCYAMAQGSHRLERGQEFYRFIQRYYPTDLHQVSIVPGVGHSGRQMFQSPQGASLLFPE